MSEVATVDPLDRYGVLSAYKEARRAVLSLALGEGAGRRATRVLFDERAFADVVRERGGDSALEVLVLGNAAEDVPLPVIAESLGVEYGRLWVWLTEDDERYERYKRAQRGAAERLVGETVDLADFGSVDRHKTQISTRFRKAGFFDRERYGERDIGVSIDVRDRRDPAELMAQLRALADANPGLRDMVGRVMEPVVDAEIVKEQG